LDEKLITSKDNKLKEDIKKQDNANVSKLESGKFYAKVGDEYKTFDNEKLAKNAVAKDEFDKSGKNFLEKDGYVYRRNSDGSVATPITKDEYDYKVGSATLTKQNRNDDVDGWIKTANKQLDSIEKQLNNPNVDDLDKLQLEDDAQVLMDNIDKYTSYGAFTKGKSRSASIAKILAESKATSSLTNDTMKKLNALLQGTTPSKPIITKAQQKQITVKGEKR
jgi:hypothetical protein